jgi:conjugal transfer pilus assembly protein TraW
MYFVFILFLYFCTSSVEAKELGTYGHKFEISEPNLLEYIESKLSNLTPEEISEHNKKISSQLQDKIQTPSSVKGLGNSQEYHYFYYDPSYKLKENITDITGKIIAEKGQEYNPLEHITLNSNLLFLDGSSKEQMNFANIYYNNKKTKWVLIKDRPLKLSGTYNREIYFDQKGYLSRQLQLKNVPAKVSQAGKYLLIEELPTLEEFSLNKGARQDE